MIRLSVTADTKKATAMLANLVERQIPYAIERAVNAVAQDVQRDVRASLPGHFTLRRRPFVERTIKVLQWGRK